MKAVFTVARKLSPCIIFIDGECAISANLVLTSVTDLHLMVVELDALFQVGLPISIIRLIGLSPKADLNFLVV